MRRFRDQGSRPRLPGRVGLLLGLGALSITGARADTAAATLPADPPSLGGLSIRVEAGRVCVTENGRDSREIWLADTPETHQLMQLLAERHAESPGTAVRFHSMILAGAGGDGFHWNAPPPRDEAAKPARGSGHGRGRSGTGSLPATHPPGNAASERTRDKG